jgi:hypothetical protein
MEFPDAMFTWTFWIAIAIGIFIYRIFKILVKRITKAVLKANEMTPYANPPEQLFVNDKKEIKPTRDRTVWWKIFWQELF